MGQVYSRWREEHPCGDCPSLISSGGVARAGSIFLYVVDSSATSWQYPCARFSLRRASTLSVEYQVSRLCNHFSSRAVRLQTRVFALAQKTPPFVSYGAPFGEWRAAISRRRNPFAELVDARAPALARCVWQFRHG